MIRGRTLRMLALFALVALPVSCHRTPPATEDSPPGPVLARVNQEVITPGDFRDEIASLPEYTQNQLRTSEQKLKRLEDMIKERVLRQEAERRGLHEDKGIQRKVERYRNRLITEKLYQEVAREKGDVSDAEVKQYYDANKDRYVQKERIRASQILILVPPDADVEQESKSLAQAEEVLQKAKGEADFGELAKEYSEGPTAVRGGDLGYFSRGRMVPEFEEAAFALNEKGDISGIVKTKFGYHIIKLTDKQAEKQLELAEINERIKRQLESQNRREVRQTLDQDLRKNASIEVNTEHLEEDSKQEPPNTAPSTGE